MASNSNASARVETPHVTQTSRTNTIVNALKRRAQSVLNDKSIDAQTRAWKEAFDMVRAHRANLKNDYGVFMRAEIHARDLVGWTGQDRANNN